MVQIQALADGEGKPSVYCLICHKGFKEGCFEVCPHCQEPVPKKWRYFKKGPKGKFLKKEN